ncbi:BlaI/MecI/CopY family transcriptional regulator [Streptomyces sp. 378]|uniref:BlaI/MecI/CopY family transcriptional regulator n=1 Tax=Streptomyces sp. 378 TaxID=3049412 RepID=UPI0024C3D03B|nr:BlaI/MecI/CopY family transcriptional regulator [Streptomyces sp. 378]MDK1345137.1 BlaI/MecI/CopY family transcriptional regulator [Streptomyces sp. 378]
MTDQNRGGAEQSRRRRGQGELETQVLAALHQAPGAVPAAWVQDRLGGSLAYTTVMTILIRLHAKGAVARERAGRSFEWTAIADAAGLAALRMRKVLDAESDREAVLARFLTSLTPGDEQVLRDLLAPGPGEGED